MEIGAPTSRRELEGEDMVTVRKVAQEIAREIDGIKEAQDG